jgi:hypothetical protein
MNENFTNVLSILQNKKDNETDGETISYTERKSNRKSNIDVEEGNRGGLHNSRKRNRNSAEQIDDETNVVKRGKRVCSRCQKTGHNSRTCTNLTN